MVASVSNPRDSPIPAAIPYTKDFVVTNELDQFSFCLNSEIVLTNIVVRSVSQMYRPYFLPPVQKENSGDGNTDSPAINTHFDGIQPDP